MTASLSNCIRDIHTEWDIRYGLTERLQFIGGDSKYSKLTQLYPWAVVLRERQCEGYTDAEGKDDEWNNRDLHRD
jgi:hypothetical protein